jgi:hypothetical protein
MKTVVLYRSISGFTRKYARWIAEERRKVRLFYFRGGLDFGKLGFPNKVPMTLLKWKLRMKRRFDLYP